MHRINAPSFKRPLNKRPSKIWKNFKNVPYCKRPLPTNGPLKRGVCSKWSCKEGGVNLRQPRNDNMKFTTQSFKENEITRFLFLFSIHETC